MKKLLPLIILLLSTSAVFAQEAITITAIPPRLELSALPGATLQETIKVRNESASEMALTFWPQILLSIITKALRSLLTKPFPAAGV